MKFRTSTLVFALICAGVMGTLLVCVRHAFREADIAATDSTIASIQSELRNYAGPLPPTSNLSDPPRMLTDTEYAAVNAFLKTKSLDTPPGKEASDEIVDCWGERFMIAARVAGNGYREFFVWSKGPDRKSGTQDDVTRPPVQTIPAVSR